MIVKLEIKSTEESMPKIAKLDSSEAATTERRTFWECISNVLDDYSPETERESKLVDDIYNNIEHLSNHLSNVDTVKKWE